MIECQYCVNFNESKKRYINSTGDFDSKSRLCSITNQFVTRSQNACDKFEKYSRFWCDKNDTWVPLEVCKKRRSNLSLYPECRHCKQKKSILSIENIEAKKQILNNFRRRKVNDRGDSREDFERRVNGR